MKIAVNTRLLLKNRLDGMGWFGYESIKRITTSHPEHSFYFLFDRKYDPEFIFSTNITPVVLPPQARHPILWFLWLELSVSRYLKKEKIDLFLSPDGFIPLRSGVPSISVIHDINFFHRPGDLPLLNRLYYNYFFPRFARKAARIGTVSEYSARDISNSYNIPMDKIDICYNGANEDFKPLDEKTKKEVKSRLTGGDSFFTFVGTMHPRKNVVNLLKAYDLFRKNTGFQVKMVIIGEKLFLTKDIERILKLMQYRKDVIFTGRLNSEDLLQVLASSMALTFVPYFEGFGIPVVEAMKCGVPVIASNVTSLPEVGGEAVLYSDPDNIEEISNNMTRIARDEDLREKMIRLGFDRVKLFSWDKTAEKLWASIKKTMDGS
jgi:glycosyltransferase involved in cell wall biosynthesis